MGRTGHQSRLPLWIGIVQLVALAAAQGVAAATLQAKVESNGGDPVSDAVVYALPLDPDWAPSPAAATAVIDQIDKEYVPYVTPVALGTKVSFPNHDRIRHHVYSFSPAKTFEIPLYKGTPPEPVVFDNAGPVPLGCNIHDWMSAYVFVSESPYFSLTREDGRATIPDVPPGSYSVRVWHPRIKGAPEATGQGVTVDGSDLSLNFTIERKTVWRPRRAPSIGGGRGYR